MTNDILPSLFMALGFFASGWFLCQLLNDYRQRYPVRREPRRFRVLRSVKVRITRDTPTLRVVREGEIDPAQTDPQLRHIRVGRWETNVYRSPEDEVASNPRYGEVDAS